MKILFRVLLAFSVVPALAPASPGNVAHVQEQVARDVIERVTPGAGTSIRVEFIGQDSGRDVFEVQSDGRMIVLRGSNPLSVTSAWNWYLRNVCKGEVSWCGSQLALPKPLPPVPQKVRIVSPYRYRYMYNYCTFSYTMAFWTWQDWERELDYLAMNGINFPLAITGQEAVWQNVYRAMGLSDSAITAFLAGPAYLSWGWMGNLDGWGGPSPQSWIDGQRELQQKILKRERELGMTPVLPAFSGHVPPGLRTQFPKADIKSMNWGAGFNDTYMLAPTDPLFTTIGAAFLREQTRLYGTDHYYSSDTFNENRPPSDDSLFLSRSSDAVYRSMASVDSQATWVMQGWLFFNDQDFWKERQVKAVLGAVPDDRMIILDLFCDVSPVWKRTDAFYGKNWIWCSLHNFGGNSSFQGNVPLIAQEPPRLLQDPRRGNLCGIGLTMEGTHHNPLYYDLLMEMLWRTDAPDLPSWLKGYALRRYGRADARADSAIRLLYGSVYSRAGRIDMGGMLCARPTLLPSGEWVTPDVTYRPLDLLRAWEFLDSSAADLGSADGYRYDLVDVGRQVLSNLSTQVQMQLIEAHARNDRAAFHAAKDRFIGLLGDLDDLVGTRPEFLLGRWIAQARAWGKTDHERRLMEWNARNQLTLWGDRNSPLHEYARKEWSGLIRGFYLPRWKTYLDGVERSMADGSPWSDSLFTEQIKKWEEEWTHGQDSYPETVQGDPLAASHRLLAKYGPICRSAYTTVRNLAFGRPVTASAGTENGYVPELAVDGRIDLSSRWSASPAPQWLQVDLGDVYPIDHIQVLPFWDGKRFYQYTVDVSADGKQWQTVVDMSGNTTPAGILGHDHRFQAVKARFARITMTANSANKAVHLVEFRVFHAERAE